ncbi:MFS transporter [Litorihabitans aurantiacus]|uniref:MFS transporter n=1 Tax=Litorihabitans aurantiacus TaxID=1930061 RepID=A0AA37XDG2_9MICO|nr:YbfB/YjiJ family MFS transporter [Litorihabitans aurantiacus]GMA31063.1 hypothetical protein GCM10025875_10550 [Litorihabitans aurantiacus]
MVAGGAGLIAVSYGIVRYGYGLQLPQLTAAFDLRAATAGAIASGSFAAYCVAAVAARAVVVRSPRAVLWGATALAAVGAVVVATAGGAPALASGVLIAGGAAGAASPALVVAVDSTVPRGRAARAQAVVNAGTGAGVAVAGLVVLALPGAWRPLWWCAAAAALLTAAVVDRGTAWPRRGTGPRGSSVGPAGHGDGRGADLVRPLLVAALAGAGSAAVWTFGRELVTQTGGLPERTSAVLWVLLGVAAVLGAASGDAVRLIGLRPSWGVTAGACAVATLALVAAPDRIAVAAVALALFGGAYTALSGVLIAWAGEVRPSDPGAATAALFTALTAGQAVGAAVTGVVVERAEVLAFAGGAVLLGIAALIGATRSRGRADIR